MKSVQQRKRQISALIISLCIHAVLVCLLFFCLFYTDKEPYGDPTSPFKDQNDFLPVTLDDLPDRAETTEVVSPDTSDSDIHASEEPIREEVHQEELPQQQIAQEAEQLIPVSGTRGQATSPGDATTVLEAPVASSFEPIKRRKRRRRPRITMLKLAQGFQSYAEQQGNFGSTLLPKRHAEKREIPDNAVYIDSKGVPHKNNERIQANNQYQHVDDELAKMAYYSYMKGVNEQLMSAFSINRERAYSDESLVSRLTLEFTILKDGTPTDVTIITSVGKENIDEYVKKIILGYTFAPLPERFKVEKIIKRLDCTAHIGQGHHKYRLTITY